MVRREKQKPEEKIKQLFKKHKELTSKPRAEGKGKWYWNCAVTGGSVLSRDGPWQPYTDVFSTAIEKAYLYWQSACYLGLIQTEIGDNPFFIDFGKMEQIRCNNNQLRRAIKREIIK